MRILLNVRIPHQPFNAMVKDGTAGSKLRESLDATKPEAAYFTEQNGQRGAVLIVEPSAGLEGAANALDKGWLSERPGEPRSIA